MQLHLLALVVVLWVVTANAHGEAKCIHDQLIAARDKRGTQEVYTQTYTSDLFPTQSNSQPMRIIVDARNLDNDNDYTCYSAGQIITTTDAQPYTQYTCTAKDVLSTTTRQYLLNTLIKGAVQLLSNTLYVVPVQGNLQVQSITCNSVSMPSEYVANGVANADLIVFLTARPTPTTHALAYALSCQDDQYNRAIAGVIDVDPKSISTAPEDYPSQLRTIAHELSHVLGFTSNKWAKFRGKTAADVLSSNNTIITPAVVKFARGYFGCSTLSGARLEDNGSKGTVGSHWEKEQWMNEYMTGQQTQNPVFSALTLALFEDSGWYYVNYQYAEPLLWGYKAGCPFATACTNWPLGNGYACTAGDQTSVCTFDLQAKGVCGGDELTSCDYIKGYSNAWCIDPLTTSSTLINSGEQYCADCRCFSSSLIKNTPTGGLKQLICYKTACVDSNTLKVWVDNFWYDCPEGTEIAVINYGGAIVCPRASLVCAQQPTDNTWPVVTIVSPDSGLPGSTITIFGQNFVNITRVYIAGECTGIKVLSPTKLTAVLPVYEQIQNPSNFLKAKANVIVVAGNGKNDLAYGAYKLQISLDEDLLKAALIWVTDHWYVVVIVGVAIGALALICWCCNKKKANNKDVHLHQVQSHPR